MLDPYLGRVGHNDFFGVFSNWRLRGPKIILKQNKIKNKSEVSLSRMLRNSRMSATHFACIAYESNVNTINSIIIKMS